MLRPGGRGILVYRLMALSQETINKLGVILEKRGYKPNSDELFRVATGIVGFFKTLIDLDQKYTRDRNKDEQDKK